MDKETLSNYGWIVICVLVLAVMIALATPFGQFISDAVWNTANGLFDTNNNALDNVLDDLGVVLTPEQLQVKYKFEYYSTLNGAVNDVNNGTIGENADANKEDAVAGIYTNAGQTYVVLLKNTTEATRVQPSVDMTINLGGHTLSTNDNVAVQSNAGTIMIDGRIDGSTIEVITTGKNMARAVQCLNDSTTIIDGGTYIGNSTSASANGACISTYHTTTLSVSNANIICFGTGGKERAICINSGSATITNCNLTVKSTEGNAYALENLGTATITNCNLKAYSNYSATGNTYTSCSSGVINIGTLTINDCYVMGTHSGVSSHGTLHVNGGTYEGYGHGGFYFSGDSSGNTSYVRDAVIRQCEMPEGYIDGGAGCNNAGFYIGGYVGEDNLNIYMDNCEIYGTYRAIVMNGNGNNTLYISNSTMTGSKSIRMDDTAKKVYIGIGNNFTADNATIPSAVIATTETYIQK